jgi:D-alanyl-D-alanine carboxypeptidase
MMLPSGNDAAFQIAQIGGSLLYMHKNIGRINNDVIYSADLFTDYCRGVENSLSYYLSQMNRTAKKIGMNNSNFVNPHGLSNTRNLSTA